MRSKITKTLLLFLLSHTIILPQSYGNWVEIDSMNISRANHAIAELPDGNILVSGGGNIDPALRSCEIYDISTGEWRSTASLIKGRSYHKMVSLINDKVLAIGGWDDSSCELFDPISEKWVLADSIPTVRKSGHTVTQLHDGRIMVCGGFNSLRNAINNCDMYNPFTERWESVSPMNQKRYYHSATLLDDGRILVCGGKNTEGDLSDCEIYDPGSNVWNFVQSMNTNRSSHSSLLLKNGNVLVSGADPYSDASGSCEIYNVTTDSWEVTAGLLYGRSNHNMYFIDDHNIMILGEDPWFNNGTSTWEIYDTNIMQPVLLADFTYGFSLYHNSIQLKDGKILLISGLEFDLTGQPTYWATEKCYLFSAITKVTPDLEKPPDYFLGNNYPNPFNPSTTIRYEIPNNSVVRTGNDQKNSSSIAELNGRYLSLPPMHVKLCIYDILGNEIATLVNQNQSPGKYSVEFDTSKYKLPSGVYIYKLTAGDFTQSRKMLLTK